MQLVRDQLVGEIDSRFAPGRAGRRGCGYCVRLGWHRSSSARRSPARGRPCWSRHCATPVTGCCRSSLSPRVMFGPSFSATLPVMMTTVVGAVELGNVALGRPNITRGEKLTTHNTVTGVAMSRRTTRAAAFGLVPNRHLLELAAAQPRPY